MLPFFSRAQERRIIAAIQEAEMQTSGEIRVHLEEDLKDGSDVTVTAVRVFNELNMQRTAERNAVLMLIVPPKKKFAIIGDSGINEKVPDNFWNDVRDVMQQNFRQKNFTEGVIEGVRLTGEKLRAHFPRSADDKNELPDEITYGSQQ